MQRKMRIGFGFGSKRKIEKEKKYNIVKGLAVGALVGSTLGVISGFLFAPKSGRETRQEIQEDVINVAKKVTENVIGTGEKAASQIKEIADRTNKLIQKKPKGKDCYSSPIKDNDLTEAEVEVACVNECEEEK